MAEVASREQPQSTGSEAVLTLRDGVKFQFFCIHDSVSRLSVGGTRGFGSGCIDFCDAQMILDSFQRH